MSVNLSILTICPRTFKLDLTRERRLLETSRRRHEVKMALVTRLFRIHKCKVVIVIDENYYPIKIRPKTIKRYI